MDIILRLGSSTQEELLAEHQKMMDQKLFAEDRLRLLDAALRQLGAARRSSPPQAPSEDCHPPASAVPPQQEEEEPKPDCYLNMEVFDDTCPTECVGFKGCKAKLKRELAKE